MGDKKKDKKDKKVKKDKKDKKDDKPKTKQKKSHSEPRARSPIREDGIGAADGRALSPGRGGAASPRHSEQYGPGDRYSMPDQSYNNRQSTGGLRRTEVIPDARDPYSDTSYGKSNQYVPPPDTGKKSKKTSRQDGMDRHKFELYSKSLGQVVSTWPEYNPLQNLDHRHLHPLILSTFQQVYQRLCEQHDSITKLSKANHNATQQIDDLEEEMEGYRRRMDDAQADMEDLRQDIIVLKGDLRKRGIEPRLPARRLRTNEESNSGAQSISRHSPDGITNNTDPNDPRLALARRMKEGMSSGVLRSRLSHIPGSEDLMNEDSGHNQDQEDLRSKLQAAQDALDRERRQCGQMEQRLQDAELQLKSGSFPSHNPDPRKSISQPSGLTINGIAEKYNMLEEQVKNRIIRAVDQYVRVAPDGRKFGFLCSTMEESFSVAADMILRFQHAIATVLTNPSNFTSALALNERTQTNTAFSLLPSYLADEIMVFLESTSDTASLKPLIEMVLDRLSRSYPEFYSSGVTSHQGYSQFLQDCCRLSWQMNVTSPAMHLSTRQAGTRYDRHFHRTNSDRSVRGASEVDYYLWPVLYRKLNGDVLVKGLVTLR